MYLVLPCMSCHVCTLLCTPTPTHAVSVILGTIIPTMTFLRDLFVLVVHMYIYWCSCPTHHCPLTLQCRISQDKQTCTIALHATPEVFRCTYVGTFNLLSYICIYTSKVVTLYSRKITIKSYMYVPEQDYEVCIYMYIYMYVRTNILSIIRVWHFKPFPSYTYFSLKIPLHTYLSHKLKQVSQPKQEKTELARTSCAKDTVIVSWRVQMTPEI